MTQTVRCEYEGAVAAITLNRPDAANALTVQAKEELLAAVRQCGADPQVRAVILTGAGRAFCAGQDLREHADSLASDERGSTPLETVRRHYNPITAAITGMPKPV
ncbi:MAG: enoyl-CoA hydratase/isomerase family protein, partial [Streptosporangiaceae bacterium]